MFISETYSWYDQHRCVIIEGYVIEGKKLVLNVHIKFAYATQKKNSKKLLFEHVGPSLHAFEIATTRVDIQKISHSRYTTIYEHIKAICIIIWPYILSWHICHFHSIQTSMRLLCSIGRLKREIFSKIMTKMEMHEKKIDKIQWFGTYQLPEPTMHTLVLSAMLY